MSVGRFLTPETIRLGLTSLAAGCVTGVLWRVTGRRKWGAVPLVLAVLVAVDLTGRSDRPRQEGPVVAGVLLMVLAGAGAARLLADGRVRWEWVALGALTSAVGVWAGVPETGPAVLAGGAIAGLGLSAVATGSGWGPAAGAGVAAVLGWAALSGAVGRPNAVIGGALCTGAAPWLAVRPLLPEFSWSRNPGPWLLGAHLALVILGARWIGVVPGAGLLRPAALSIAGLAVAAATRLRA